MPQNIRDFSSIESDNDIMWSHAPRSQTDMAIDSLEQPSTATVRLDQLMVRDQVAFEALQIRQFWHVQVGKVGVNKDVKIRHV